MRITDMGAELERYARAHAAELRIVPFVVSRDQMTRFVNGELKNPRIEGFMRAAWAWLSAMHPKALDSARKDATWEAQGLSPFFREMSRFFYEGDKPPVEKLEGWSGTFTAYRRSFLNPEGELLKMGLTCGLDDQPTAFSLSLVYPYLHRTEIEAIDGEMLPLKSGAALFVGRLIEKEAAFIFALGEHIILKGLITESKGVMLVVGTGIEPVAWPIIALRDDDPQAGAIAIQDLEPSLARTVMPVMNRGYIARRSQ